MKYRHTPRFQQVLRGALTISAQDRDFSEQKTIDKAGLVCSKSTLNRFHKPSPDHDERRIKEDDPDRVIERVGYTYLNGRDAEALWNHLDEKGFIEQAIHQMKIQKKSLYPMSDVANALHCFFEVDPVSTKKFIDSGLEGKFFCYKPSFRRSGFTVKSLMTFKPVNGDYFSIEEQQRTSGVFEMDRKGIIEVSEGFGIVKSNRVWLFLRDVETDQPRIFCFYKQKFAQLGAASGKQNSRSWETKISNMSGYLIEGAIGNEDNAFNYHVMLIEAGVDADLWQSSENPYKDRKFDEKEQIDVFPTSADMKERYKDRLKDNPVFIDPEILIYLEGGDARSVPTRRQTGAPQTPVLDQSPSD